MTYRWIFLATETATCCSTDKVRLAHSRIGAVVGKDMTCSEWLWACLWMDVDQVYSECRRFCKMNQVWWLELVESEKSVALFREIVVGMEEHVQSEIWHPKTGLGKTVDVPLKLSCGLRFITPARVVIVRRCRCAMRLSSCLKNKLTLIN